MKSRISDRKDKMTMAEREANIEAFRMDSIGDPEVATRMTVTCIRNGVFRYYPETQTIKIIGEVPSRKDWIEEPD
jgi:hypothetical protein